MHVDCDCGLICFWWLCSELCISSFVDDDMLSYYGLNGSVSLLQQQRHVHLLYGIHCPVLGQNMRRAIALSV